MRPVPLSREEVIKRSQQEVPKTTLGSIRHAEDIFCEDLREESLRQILRIVRPVSFAADVNVNGVPISAAKFFQGKLGSFRGGLARRQNDAPMRRGKDPRSFRCGIRIE